MNPFDRRPITAEGLWRSQNEQGIACEPPAEAHVVTCGYWIEQFARPSSKIFKERSSYGLKHDVEEWAGDYISNGAFIEAARRAGYRIVRVAEDSLNAWFNMRFVRRLGDPKF